MQKTDDEISTGRLKILLEVGRAFNSVIEVDRLLNLIAVKTAELLKAERCSIYVVDRESDLLWTRVATGEGRIEIPFGSGIAGAVAETGLIINVPDAYSDPRFNPDIDRKTGYKTDNMLSGPMINSSGEIIGVFQVLNRIGRPFNIDDEGLLSALSGFAGNALENALLYDELKTTFHSVIEVLAATIDAKHPYTAGHTARVAEYACGIAAELGLDHEEIEILRVAAFLHDYGKIGIKDSILTKPGKLSDGEFAEMRSHAAKTREILSKMYFSRKYKDIPAVAGAHHEKYDGSGYPMKLADGDIPLGARILAVADVFDALTSDRDYRRAMPLKEAIELMEKDDGKAFDPQVFRGFRSYFAKKFGS